MRQIRFTRWEVKDLTERQRCDTMAVKMERGMERGMTGTVRGSTPAMIMAKRAAVRAAEEIVKGERQKG